MQNVWFKFKYVVARVFAFLKRLGGQAKASFDEMVPSKNTQAVILAVFFLLEFLIAYLIALLDIGIWRGMTSIFEMVEEYYLQDRKYPFITLLFFTILLVLAFYVVLRLITGDDGRNFKFSESNVYGSAREISMEHLYEVAEVKPIEALSGTILGQLDTTGQRVIGIHPDPIANKNLIIFGTPGVGKSYSVVKPLIVQAIRRGESVVCTDTKYEVRADTLELARRYGYTIRFFDLKDLLFSDGWHVLKELRCDDVRAMTFAEIVMKNTGNPKDPHLALEQSLLRACCLYVERSRSIPENEKTLYTAYSLILQGPEALDKTFEIAKYDADLRVAYDAYASFTGSDNLRANVIANLASRLQIVPTARLATSTDDIDLTLPGKQKCIYYCCMSDMHETMKFLATLFFSFLFLDLGDYADSLRTRRLPVPVNVVLEEAANIGEIVGLDKYLSTARSRAISITMILQGIGQLRNIYGEENTDTILNDCSIHACIGTNDEATADHFEWFSGEATIKVKTEQHERIESPLMQRFHHSTGDGKRFVYTSNEIRKIRRGYILVGWQGYDTIMCRTFGINQHPEYKKGNMPVIEPHIKVPLANTEARNYMRAMEEQRVIDYEAWEKDGGFAWEGYNFPKPQYDGPSRHKPAPKVIPYPELEQMALEHAAQANSSFEEEMLQQASQREEAALAAGEPIIELPPDLEWDDTPLPTKEVKTTDSTPDDFEGPSPEVANQAPVSLVTPPIVMADPPKKPLTAPPTDPFTPPTTEQPRRSGGATLYAKKIKRQIEPKERKKG